MLERNCFAKKGLSPVIASVFLILLVLVLSSLIFSWSRDFVNDRAEENTISSAQVCNAVSFKIAIVDKDGENYDFEVVNRGDIDIDSLKFRIYPGGDSNVVDSNVGISAGGAITGNVVLSEPIDRVEVLPVLSEGPSEVVCDEYYVYLKGID